MAGTAQDDGTRLPARLATADSIDSGLIDISIGSTPMGGPSSGKLAAPSPTAGSTPESTGPSPNKIGREMQIAEDTDTAGVDCAEEEDDARSMQRAAEAQNIRLARLVSIASLVASAVAALFGISFGIVDETLSLVGFGMEAALDGISSALVLWRFKKGKQRQHKDAEAAEQFKEVRDARRERNSSIGIGITFVLSAVLLYCSAFVKLAYVDAKAVEHESEEGADMGIIVAVPSVVVFGGLAVWKLRLARALKSQVLYKDGLCSVLGTVLALICVIAGILEEASGSPEGMAKVDAVASGLIATILGAEGCRTLYHNLGAYWALEHKPMAS